MLTELADLAQQAEPMMQEAQKESLWQRAGL
jgi:hypothetical protein